MINRRSRFAAQVRAGIGPRSRRSRPTTPAATLPAPTSPESPPLTTSPPHVSVPQDAAQLPTITSLAERTKALWHGPVKRVAREAIGRAVGSWLVAGELVALGAIFVVCFSTSVTVSGFYEAAGLWLAVVAVAGSAALVTSVCPAAQSARYVSHRDYRAMAGGLVLAAVTIQWVAALLLMALAVVFGRMSPFDVGAFAAGAIGLLANLALLCAVTVLLLPPFGTQVLRLGFLAWLALALYSYTAGAPGVLSVARLPLLPFGVAFTFGQTGRIDAAGLLALLVELAFIAALIALADWSTPRRKRLRV